MQYFCLFLANQYFPEAELPELYTMYRVMVSTSSARQLQKNVILFSNDIEYWVQEHVDEDTDESLFIPLFGKLKKKGYTVINMELLGNYACDLPVTRIAYSAVVYLRNNLVRFWYDTFNLINGQCENIVARKYYRDHDQILTNCLLDIRFMPLPSLQIMYPQLR